MGNAINTQTSTYIQVSTDSTHAQILAALYALFFLPNECRIVFSGVHQAVAAEPSLQELARQLGLEERVVFSDNPKEFSPLTGIEAEDPETFASQVFAKLR